MKKLVLVLMLLAFPARAELQYIGGYHPKDGNYKYFKKANENYHYPRSIIFVFYNSRDNCHNCEEAMGMARDVYEDHYRGIYDFYVVDYETDKEYNYIGAYKLSRPLEVVLVRVDHDQSTGYKKIENLQNHISNKISFEHEMTNQIDGFLRR